MAHGLVDVEFPFGRASRSSSGTARHIAGASWGRGVERRSWPNLANGSLVSTSRYRCRHCADGTPRLCAMFEDPGVRY